MAEPVIFSLTVRPGIQRDGTVLDSNGYVDGQWVRFQRGRPRKMGGFRELATDFAGPVSAIQVWGRQGVFSIIGGSPYGIEQLSVNADGVGAYLVDRTPSGFVADPLLRWQFATQYDDAVGAAESILIAHPSKTAGNIDDGTEFPIYVGGLDDTAILTTTGVSVAGGVAVANPYLIAYGNDGQVMWTNANEPTNFTTGDAGSDRVTAFKIVKGLPVRSGSGPAALLWSIDSLLKMQYVGGDAIFRFDTISAQSTVLSPSGIIEYDGVYFWAGVDRFYVFDGALRELPNDTNLNWFYDNLNWNYRAKVWAMKIPRWGEVIWFYPRGDATECSHAVVFNVRERTWYDFELSRTAGYSSQLWRFPVMTGEKSEPDTYVLSLINEVGVFTLGETVTGSISGATGVIERYIDLPVTKLNVISVTGTFALGDVVTGDVSGATGEVDTTPYTQGLFDVWMHEYGVDRVTDEEAVALESFFETGELGLTTGGPAGETPQGVNRFTRLTRLEPDFIMTGEMEMSIVSTDYAHSPKLESEKHVFNGATEKIEPRGQFRQFRLRFRSDVLGGTYQMGRVLLHVAPGDGRV